MYAASEIILYYITNLVIITKQKKHSGESYAGMYGPMLAANIINGNDAKLQSSFKVA